MHLCVHVCRYVNALRSCVHVCAFMWANVHVCYVHVHAHVCTCVQMCGYVCACVLVNRYVSELCSCVFIRVHVHVCALTCVSVHVCACACACTCVCVCAHVVRLETSRGNPGVTSGAGSGLGSRSSGPDAWPRLLGRQVQAGPSCRWPGLRPWFFCTL